MSINIRVLASLENLEDLAKLDLDTQLAVIDSIQAGTVPFQQRMSLPFPYKLYPIPSSFLWVNFLALRLIIMESAYEMCCCIAKCRET